MKTIIAGGRDFDNLPLLSEVCDKYRDQITEVVSGCQATWDYRNKRYYGADHQGEQWAESRGIPVKPFPADWDRYGKAAGPIRNADMAQYADAVILFPGGRGTASMKRLAQEHGLVILYDPGC